ncbi:MAG: carboxypeptidase-like regulatory domain-containing protein [Blastocatellia bacterium]
MTIRFITCTALLLTIFSITIAAQNPAAAKAAGGDEARPAVRIGSLKGRVINSEGQPMAGVTVNAIPVGRTGARRPGMPGGLAQAVTDDEGSFLIDGLLPASYALSSSAPGWMTLPPEDENSAGIYHPGDAVTLTMVKGGVITGKVMNAAGEPLTGLSVSAIRIGNVDGEADALPVAGGFNRNWRTDDQGVYRIYGLVPGSYIVQAGGRGGFGPNFPSEFSENAPTYYPSSVRDTAVSVTVRAAEEVRGIDIRWRGEKGHAVSGKAVVKAEAGNGFGGVQISLSSAISGAVIATTFQMDRGPGRGFAFYGVPDGDYEITARSGGFSATDNDSVSLPRRFSLRGNDVSGLELTLAPLASISGKVTIERKPGVCQNPRASFVEEVLLTPQRDENSREMPPRPAAPTASGDFLLRNLEAGRWRINPLLPDDNWYVRALTLSKPSAPARRTTNAAASTVTSPVREGITLRAGEKLSGVALTITEGAAGMTGTVTDAEGVKPAGKTSVFLVPVEKEAADDLLRYAHTNARNDGSFQFRHLAPGRYYLLARPVSENESSDAVFALLQDSARRTALRRAAEAGGITIELSPCQRVPAYQLRTTAANEKPE